MAIFNSDINCCSEIIVKGVRFYLIQICIVLYFHPLIAHHPIVDFILQLELNELGSYNGARYSSIMIGSSYHFDITYAIFKIARMEVDNEFKRNKFYGKLDILVC